MWQEDGGVPGTAGVVAVKGAREEREGEEGPEDRPDRGNEIWRSPWGERAPPRNPLSDMPNSPMRQSLAPTSSRSN